MIASAMAHKTDFSAEPALVSRQAIAADLSRIRVGQREAALGVGVAIALFSAQDHGRRGFDCRLGREEIELGHVAAIKPPFERLC
jgi:hypothetical protein